ncbi:MAG: hypothetical protein K6G11_10350, partial [Lachnospiraceae bacterium]|nr:hypothetical protein [Lachnospiraceae bacterium]
MKRNYKEMIKKVFNIIRLTFSVIFCLFIVVFLCNKSNHFPQTDDNERFPGEYDKIIKKYDDFEELSTNGSFTLPGLTETNVHGLKCSAMTPQGICTTEKYILITAYCRGKLHKVDLATKIYKPTNVARLAKNIINEDEAYEHRSVIYVIDKKTKDYMTTLCLDDMNHVGGITYDGHYAWIAKSSDYELSAINIKTIDKAVKKHCDAVNVKYDATIACDRMASFVTYFDNRLWVGFCNGDTKGNGVLDGFDISYDEDEDGNTEVSLLSSKEISIPYNANGAVFAKIEGDVCLAVSLSGGRNNNSKICMYQVDLNKNSDISGFMDYGKYLMPPLMEEMCIDGTNLYYIFESGSSAYSTVAGYKTKAPVDRVCIGDVQNLFYWKDANYIDAFESYKLSTPSAISNAKEAMYLPNYIYEIHDGGSYYFESENNAETETVESADNELDDEAVINDNIDSDTENASDDKDEVIDGAGDDVDEANETDSAPADTNESTAVDVSETGIDEDTESDSAMADTNESTAVDVSETGIDEDTASGSARVDTDESTAVGSARVDTAGTTSTDKVTDGSEDISETDNSYETYDLVDSVKSVDVYGNLTTGTTDSAVGSIENINASYDSSSISTKASISYTGATYVDDVGDRKKHVRMLYNP